jgi:hypothetical protein
MGSMIYGHKQIEEVPVDTTHYITRRKVAESKEHHLMKTKKE